MEHARKDQPATELEGDALQEVNGGCVLPEPDCETRTDPVGGMLGDLLPPVDYSAVSGGDDCLTPPTEDVPPANPVIKALQDVWNGIF